jgi:ABC-type amino acid transport substrate-binding protein
MSSTGRFTWPVRRRMPPGPEGTAEDIAVQDVAEREAADRQLPPPDPEPLVDPPPRFNLAVFRLAALGLALVLALGLAVVQVVGDGPPSVDDLRAQAGVDSWTSLPVGVKDDQPGTAYHDPENGQWSGFDVDLAYMIAEDLGFRRDDVKFYAIESEDRARMQATGPDGKRVPVKLVIASYSITEQRKLLPGVLFSAPYLYTEQSVLTKPGHSRVSSIADLTGERVCSISASTSTEAPEGAHAIVLSRNKISQCIDDLDEGRVSAITTDATILAGYKAKFRDKYTHWDLGAAESEAYGVNVGDNPALQELVDITLYRSYADPKDARWEEAFDRNFRTEMAANGATPIAVAQQPRVGRPGVREMPWENVFG